MPSGRKSAFGKPILTLTVVAASAEASNGASASVSQAVEVRVLAGTAVATPVSVNPFVVLQAATQQVQVLAGSAAVRPAAAATSATLVAAAGMLAAPAAPLVPPKTAAEIAQAEADRARALSDAWLKELEERAKAQWEQLMGGR